MIKKGIDQFGIYKDEDLCLFSKIFFATFLLFGYRDISSYATENPEMFIPPILSLPWLTGGLPSFFFLTLLSIILLVSTIANFFKFHPKLFLPLFLLSYILGKGVEYSWGKVDHDQILIPVFVLLLFLNTWKTDRGPILSVSSVYFMMAFAIGWAFFTAGLGKLLSGWLYPLDHAFKNVVVFYTFGVNPESYGKYLLENLHSSIFWEVFDWLIVFFEIAFIATIFKRFAFYFALWACVFFHLSNYFVLGITFNGALIFYLLFQNIRELNKITKVTLVIIALMPFCYELLIQNVSNVTLFQIWSYFVSGGNFTIFFSLLLSVVLISNFNWFKQTNQHSLN